MKKSFKSIMALFLALALLCAAIPAASAYNVDDLKGEIFDWDVSSSEYFTGDIKQSDNSNYFGVIPSEDVVAQIDLSILNPKALSIDIYEGSQALLYSVDYTKSVNLVMEAGKMYSFNIHYKSGIANPPAGDFSITLSKYADFTVPEEPTPTGSGNGYLWNGTGSVTYKTYYAQDLYYKSTLYYVAKDTTFDLSFNAVGYNNNMQIIIIGPG